MIDSTWIAEVAHEQRRSGGDGIDSGEAKRSRLSADFPLKRGIQEIRGQPAIGRTIRPRNVHQAAQTLLLLPWLSR
ncbi:hypothetical protein [Paenibacillus amylolyticus]|uniref:hypothetical protein n=1 Tax=Paenibacillus amylolyticus TaxID=1451 RepID=UPI00286A4B68|nr:hypothetical protein [Paenibacillus amylolyticus]